MPADFPTCPIHTGIRERLDPHELLPVELIGQQNTARPARRNEKQKAKYDPASSQLKLRAELILLILLVRLQGLF